MTKSSRRSYDIPKFVVTIISLQLFFQSIRSTDTKESVIWYFTTFLFITGYNFLQVFKTRTFPISLNPIKLVPTYAAFIRSLICLVLIIPLGSPFYSRWLPFVYLIFYAIISFTYNFPVYHFDTPRKIRIFFDLAFAVSFASVYDPIKNPSWLAFLLPIAVSGRYYRPKWSFIISFTSFIYIFVLTITPQFSEYLEFFKNMIGASFSWKEIIYQKEVVSFGKYIQFTDISQLWQQTKYLIVIGCIFFIIPMFYFDETRNRLGSIFQFGRYLDSVLSASKKQITPELLEFLCFYVNSESVIAVQDTNKSFNSENTDENSIDQDSPPKIITTFQTHGNFYVTDQLELTGNLLNNFENMVLNKLEDTRETNEPRIYKNTISYLRSKVFDKKDPLTIESFRWQRVNTSDISIEDFGFWEYVSFVGGDDHIIKSIQEFFFEGDIKLMDLREKASMYENFEIVTIVVIQIRGWKLFFINNFPHGYRVVPRVFWNDGLEKIQLIKSKLG